MAKRIKKYFSRYDQVIHLWANQVQDSARSRNVFFEGTKIYSYGKHYLLGEIVNYKGVKVAVINNRGYSVTTRKHISYAYHATRHLPTISVSDIDAFWPTLSVERGLIKMQDILINDIMGALDRRVFYRYANAVTSSFNSYYAEPINNFNMLARMLKHRHLVIKVPKELQDVISAHINKCLERSKDKQLEREKKNALKRLESLVNATQEIADWRRGGDTTYAVRNVQPQILRLKGDVLETSRGASVPLSDARQLLRAIQNNTAVKGYNIGGFTYDGMMNGIITIGCHEIALSEAESLLGEYEGLALVASNG